MTTSRVRIIVRDVLLRLLTSVFGPFGRLVYLLPAVFSLKAVENAASCYLKITTPDSLKSNRRWVSACAAPLFISSQRVDEVVAVPINPTTFWRKAWILIKTQTTGVNFFFVCFKSVSSSFILCLCLLVETCSGSVTDGRSAASDAAESSISSALIYRDCCRVRRDVVTHRREQRKMSTLEKSGIT